jgi:hypothetical protein
LSTSEQVQQLGRECPFPVDGTASPNSRNSRPEQAWLLSTERLLLDVQALYQPARQQHQWHQWQSQRPDTAADVRQVEHQGVVADTDVWGAEEGDEGEWEGEADTADAAEGEAW